MKSLKGWRTVLFGLLLVIAPPALNYLAGVDWTHLVGPNVALMITGGITILLRVVTTTPVGTKTIVGAPDPGIKAQS